VTDRGRTFAGGTPAPGGVADRPKHVIANYRHRDETVECVCGWTGSSASPDGRSSPWSLHVAANRQTKP
jgi:hypothetical protein